MLKRVRIENFRAIKELDTEVGPITVLYGENDAGKSSLFYALYVLKNLLSNPNRRIDDLFNLTFINLGGFEQVVHKHDLSSTINILVEVIDGNHSIAYGVGISRDGCRFGLAFANAQFLLQAALPYPANQQQRLPCDEDEFGEHAIEGAEIIWNGLVAQVILSSKVV